MNAPKITSRDQPLTSEDLAICQHVLEAFKAEFPFDGDYDETSRTAAITIELYRQGVRNFNQLKALIFATRGKF